MENIDNKDFIKRINEFIVYNKLSITKFEAFCDLGKGIISAAKYSSGSLGSDKLIKILIAYPELNSDWLLLGRGEMLKKESSEPIKKETKNLDCEKENLFLLEKIKMLQDKILLLEENNNLLKQLHNKS